jgi:hypothetical protein
LFRCLGASARMRRVIPKPSIPPIWAMTGSWAYSLGKAATSTSAT